MSSLNRDFIYKLVTNFVRMPVSFAIQALSIRLLGPQAYGNFEFLTSYSTKIVAFFETGTSTAFYTKLSKEKDNYRLLRFYWYLTLGISGVYFSGFVLLWQLGLYEWIWTGQTAYLIFLSVFWGIFTFIGKIVLKVVDAQNLTAKGEVARVIHQVISLIFIGVLFLLNDSIDLELFFYCQLIIVSLPTFLLWNVLHRNQIPLFPTIRIDKKYRNQTTRWFWSYSNPLLVYSLVSLLVGLGDRWLLQRFGGAIEQGYFGLSFKVGAFIFLFTSAVIPLLIREFSKAVAKEDMERVRYLFVRNSRILYFLASVLAVYVFYNATFITSLFGGEEFNEAGFVVALMAFYPVHQTYGQLNGSLYFSSERTREYRNVGLILMPFGLACSFFLIAPEKYWGLNLGAEGLAFQMIGIQVITVNVLLFRNSKYLKIPYLDFVINQVLILGLLLLLGWGVSRLFVSIDQLVVRSLLELIVYGGLSVFLIWIFPALIGLRKAEIAGWTTQIKNKIRRK